MFQNKTQVDVVAVLMLLGESTIWKIIWSRLRSQRRHLTNFVFSISPGWAPLAATLLAWLSDADRPPNLIFDRCPDGATDSKLLLTNLNSGATHSADSAVLQNIWQTWIRANVVEPENLGRTAGESWRPKGTKKVGVVDVDVDNLKIGSRLALYTQLGCLVLQFGGACVVAFLSRSPEVVIVLLIALTAQSLLLFAILPHEKTWYKAWRRYRSAPVMLHKGHDSTCTLIVRKTRHKGQIVSLEEFCWSFESPRIARDLVKPGLAAASFTLFVLQIIAIGWMSQQSRIYYLIFGLLGLLANVVEGMVPGEWRRAYRDAFSGPSNCSPAASTLMSTVGILVAGKFPSGLEASKRLYPANSRFTNSLADLQTGFERSMCPECQLLIRDPFVSPETIPCTGDQRTGDSGGCTEMIHGLSKEADDKQLSDGYAAVYHLLVALRGSHNPPSIETAGKILTGSFYPWSF